MKNLIVLIMSIGKYSTTKKEMTNFHNQIQFNHQLQQIAHSITHINHAIKYPKMSVGKYSSLNLKEGIINKQYYI